jgi:hypothetical protein
MVVAAGHRRAKPELAPHSEFRADFWFNLMTLENLFYLAQIVAAVAVIVSLAFIAVQIRANTAALQRSKHNSTMAQWTVIRMTIARTAISPS